MIIQTIKKILQILGLLIAASLVMLMFLPLAKEYLTLDHAVGGDYYNGLTYAVQFSRHLPFPPSGWLSFWHEGIPVIGGYQIFPFYIMAPLFSYMDAATAMETFAIVSQFLFLLTSLLLFYEVSKSAPVSLLLTFIILKTKASFYQLFAEGLIVASTIQWLLPLTLFFIYRSFMNPSEKKNKIQYIALAGITTGISILSHPAMGLLTVFLPSVVVLFVLTKAKRLFLFVYSSISFGIGIPTLYYLFVQFAFGGGVSGMCTNPQCWGLYPQHFVTWFSVLTPIAVITLLLLAFTVKLVRRKAVSLAPIVPPIAAFFILSLYLVAAYFHKIDILVASIFPRRIFWALNILLLLIAASSYRVVSESIGKKLFLLPPLLSTLTILAFLYINPNSFDPKDSSSYNYPSAYPSYIDKYIVPKYQKGNTSKFLPDWVTEKAKTETNYRFDSLNSLLVHWWNAAFLMPATRGYSNFLTGEAATWQYFFQVGTAEGSKKEDRELVKRQTLFLIDHYGVGLYDDSGRGQGGVGYDLSVLEDPEVIIKNESGFYDISDETSSSIVSATNAIPILVVSDKDGYETVLRALSLTGINSQKVITIAGVDNINKLSIEEISKFPAVILYHPKGNNWDKLKSYVEEGGKVFIDINSKSYQNLPDFLPVKDLYTIEVEGDWLPKNLKQNPLTKNIDAQKFSPFEYEGNSWKITRSDESDVNSWTQPLFGYENYVVLSEGTFGKGNVILSGLNLPFHIVENENSQEIELFANIIKSIANSQNSKNPVFTVERPFPETISIKGANFRGVYFKENYNSGWKARVNQQDSEVYKAGLGFMYIPVSFDHQSNPTISIYYSGSITTWLLFLGATSVFIGSALLAIFPKLFIYLYNKSAKRLSKWLLKEEWDY